MFQPSGFNPDIGLLSVEGDREWEPLLQEEYPERDPQISPDGSEIVYTRGWVDKMEDRSRSNLWIVDVEGTRNVLEVVPSGVYLVTIKAEGSTDVKSVAVVNR